MTKPQLFIKHLLYTVETIYHNNKRFRDLSLYCPSPLAQHKVIQQSRQPKIASPVQIWVSTIAHLSFIWEQHWMQHIQQQCPKILPQQFEAALTKISAASGSLGSSHPGGMLSAVAVKLPKPTHRLCSGVTFWLKDSAVFCARLSFDTCCFIFGTIHQKRQFYGDNKNETTGSCFSL